MFDMYHPALDAHYLASASQVRVLRKSGWVLFSEWEAEHPTEVAPAEAPAAAPAAAEAPAPAPAEAPVETTTTTATKASRTTTAPTP